MRKLFHFQFGHTLKKIKSKSKSKKKKNHKEIKKRKNSKKSKKKKQRKEKDKKNQKSIIIKNQKKKKESLFSVVLDKICVFCFYPIFGSQQCVKSGSCRRSILFGLLISYF